MLCLNILCRCPQFPACLLQCVLIPADPGASPWSPSCKISSYFVIWLAERLLLRHGLMLTRPTLLSSEPLPWEAVGGENPRAGTRKSDISEQDHSGDQPLSSSFTGQCWGGPHMLPALHPTNPSCLKGGIFRSSWSPWPLGIQPPAHPMGAGLWGTCGRAPLAMLCLHRGMESWLSRREFLPWGLPCVAPAANPSRALNATVEQGPRGTQVGPPQPLQCSLCSPFGPSSLGRMERAENCAFSSHLQTVMMVKWLVFH